MEQSRNDGNSGGAGAMVVATVAAQCSDNGNICVTEMVEVEMASEKVEVTRRIEEERRI